MATGSAKRLLTANGFRLERQGTHGEIWSDGDRNIMVSRHAEAGHPGLKKDLRNALRDREEKNPIAGVMPKVVIVDEEIPVSRPEPVREPVQEKPAQKHPCRLPPIAVAILTDEELTSDQKVRMMLVYAEIV